MPRMFCPYCLERVDMEESIPGAPARCPVCARTLDPDDEEGLIALEYGVQNPDENPHKGPHVQAYVQALEKRARREEKSAREPQPRARPPVDLIAGVILLSGGALLLLIAFTREGGLMSSFVNFILPALLFMLLGAACLMFRAR